MGSRKVFKRNLQVKLTEDELLKRGEDLARTMQDVELAKRRLKEVTGEYKATIQKHESEQVRLTNAVANKYEYRDVECYWSYDYRVGMKTMYRIDTMEAVEVWPISDNERQQRIPEEVPPEEKPAEEATGAIQEQAAIGG